MYNEPMERTRIRRRRPTATAVVVGTLAFLISAGLVGVPFAFAILWLKQVNPILSYVVTLGGGFAVVLAIMYVTVFLMEGFEKATGVSLRTRSSRQRS